MTTMVAKLSQRSCGDPRKAIVNLPEAETRKYMGSIIGEAVGIARRTSPDGEKVHEGLKGAFEATSSETGEVTSSATLYLPEGMAESFLGIFRKDNPPASMLIGLDVGIIRASNPQGYSWELTPQLADTDTVDPLKLAREKFAAAKTAIADKGKKPTQVTAPAPSKK